jgi:serine/threonine protein kinase
MRALRVLVSWLKANGHNKAAQAIEEVTEYDEPWQEEAVKEFGDAPVSEDEYFKENFFEEFVFADIDEKIMDQEGFIYHSSVEGETHFVGSGVSGSVYRGIYNGQPAVIKIIRRTEYKNDNEISNWKAILAAKDKMPASMQKHIPIIYNLNSGNLIDEKSGDKVDYEVVIMEELQKLSPHMQDIFYQYGSAREPMKKMLKDEEYMFEIAKMIKSSVDKIKDFGDILSEVTPQDILKVILSIEEPIDKYSAMDIVQLVSEYLVQVNKEAITDIFLNSGLSDLYPSPEGFLQQKIYQVVKGSIKPDTIPRNREYLISNDGSPGFAYSAFWENSPDTGGLYKTLRELSENFNISWRDTHTDNIMMDKNGNLKIIDVGLYDVSQIDV